MKGKEFDFNQWEEGLDDLFRKAAASEQPAPPPQAWLKMNQLLDEDEEKRRRRFGWWWLPLLLFMAGHRHFLPHHAEHSTIHASSAIPVNRQETTKINQRARQTQQAAAEQLAANTSAPTISPIVADKPSQAPLTPGSLQVVKQSDRVKQQANQRAVTRLSATNTTKQPALSSFYQEEKLLVARLPKKIPLSGSGTVQASEPRMLLKIRKPASKTPDASSFRFYLYGGGGADRGFIDADHSSAYKLAYGGGIGVQLTRHWAIQAGIQQTRKIYEAPGDAYTPKKGSYYDNPNLQLKEVDADCSILEIPISIRYGFLQKNKQQLFGMLSIQNAVMLRESYNYYYYRFGQPAKGYYTYRTKAFELFSGIGLSIGYERKISKQLHWQIAPYFNFPLNGVGEGSVKLRSAGFFTGLRYSFWKKN
ncbi:outer membrane beta-barrel protein [Flavihumibacter sp. CACIAM 22H1]|uniref:outer membrane beta-barrel protein n=1 Tax=Flavihumibacter sp. CACIAM 22H1 TaxID=1812911 RepID=UPI0007A822E7|nr:outer membrane beta-barrel protein [Flavihumibacter sp. CACIAM 22H1]KYP15982.1 MAG: hypothetical protein A1D16_06895 [Flavihumibacter sp. CACIAM 22H1]